MSDLPGGVPGRTRRELGFFKQHDIGQSFVCEVVGKAAAHDTTTDDDDGRVARYRGCGICFIGLSHGYTRLADGGGFAMLIIRLYACQQ